VPGPDPGRARTYYGAAAAFANPSTAASCAWMRFPGTGTTIAPVPLFSRGDLRDQGVTHHGRS
jgi:hypothetical protein